jgi:hypothetical protein
MKTILHKLWIKFLTACKILIPFGTEGNVRLNVRNPLAYIVLFLSMVVSWLCSIVWALLVTTCEGFYALFAVYITTIRRGFEDAQAQKLKDVKEGLRNFAAVNKTVMPGERKADPPPIQM